MVKVFSAAIAALGLAHPLAAQAQDRMADYAYCAALSEKYVRYVGNSQYETYNRRPDVEGRVALEKCRQGDTAWAIPVLERKLINGKVALPGRG